jgi:ribosome-associated protein
LNDYYSNAITAVKAAAKALDDKFGQDIVVLDISEISPLADFFIIATGSNPNQLKAMCDAAEEALFKNGQKLNHSEGLQSGNWVLLDFGNIIVHIFDKENRDFYNLERIWGDAKPVTT